MRLGQLALADPVVKEIVGTEQVTVPGAGEIENSNKLLGLDGIEGIKFVEFDQRDVVRHALVQKVITAYGRWEQVKQERAAEARAGSASG